MRRQHIPVYVVSGFLGAGKTTLLNRVLGGSHGIRFAVIVNEFGEIGLDDALIEGSRDFVKMDNGCLCCALNADLMRTIDKLKDRDDYDAVILETTGVADPLPIAWTFFREPFQGCYRFGGIVTVVDALHFDKMTQEAFEVALQVERADYLYVAKTRAVPGRQLEALKVLLAEINPNARVVLDTDDDWMDLLFDFGGDAKTLSDAVMGHDHARSYQSLSVSLEDRRTELASLEDLFESLPPAVFRAKAVFRDAASGKVLALHAVCGRVESYELGAAPALPACVFIGRDFDRQSVERAVLEVCPPRVG